jgi:hypothetical protein
LVANLGELSANAAKPGGELMLWDVTTGREVSTLRRGIRPIRALAYSSDGRRLALTELLDLSGPVAVWVWDPDPARGDNVGLRSAKRRAFAERRPTLATPRGACGLRLHAPAPENREVILCLALLEQNRKKVRRKTAVRMDLNLARMTVHVS